MNNNSNVNQDEILNGLYEKYKTAKSYDEQGKLGTAINKRLDELAGITPDAYISEHQILQTSKSTDRVREIRELFQLPVASKGA